ncbi:hypothetical protein KIH87_14125 [Paraneptunicella aestuarii]|uniref:hypothetical protein n=1 Tax=Paraneptunicella aestuarii TaxID=2831148 RepID=UPI001E34268C|nr:hypothetical protein [Paraneptunicella aestuarii]UAA37830.1 hypothetical protein KIH87_14125 [Paraneptunicella aestuarii]
MNNLSPEQLKKAVDSGIITQVQYEQLMELARAENSSAAHSSISVPSVLYNVGGVIAYVALVFLLSISEDALGGWGIIGICVAYVCVAVFVIQYFQRQQQSHLLGISATFLVFVIPLLCYGIALAMGWWPEDTASNELLLRTFCWSFAFATFVGALCVLKWLQVPFLMMPVSLCLAYLLIEFPYVWLGYDEYFETWHWVIAISGGVITFLALLVEKKVMGQQVVEGKDFTFWLYILGVSLVWLGIMLEVPDKLWEQSLFFAFNLALLAIGTWIKRNVFLLWGAMGGIYYLFYLAHEIFADTPLYPLSLTAIAGLVIYLGIRWSGMITDN